jgi:hypothetical protein
MRIHVAWRWFACLKTQKLLRHVSPQEHRSSGIETTLGLTPPTRAKSSIAPGNRCLGRAGDHRRFSAIESLSESDLLKCVEPTTQEQRLERVERSITNTESTMLRLQRKRPTGRVTCKSPTHDPAAMPTRRAAAVQRRPKVTSGAAPFDAHKQTAIPVLS